MENPSTRVNLSLPVLERLQGVIVDECNQARRMYEVFGRQLQLTICSINLSEAHELRARYEEDVAQWEDAYLEVTGAIIDAKNNRRCASDMWIEV